MTLPATSNLTQAQLENALWAAANALRGPVDEGLIDDLEEVEHKTAGQIIDSIAERLKKRLDGPSGDHVVFKSLAERLDKLREQVITTATNSIEWLREAFTLAADLTDAERADVAGTQGLDLLPDPRVGALTQIFEEYAPADTPVMIKNVVLRVDEIVRQVIADNSGWVSTQKGDRTVRQALMKVLRDHQLWDAPNLYEKAYEYIAKHYD